MTTVALVPPREPNDDFVISDYLHLLTSNPNEKGKYICPACEGHNLSIEKNGLGYDCYNCKDTKKIAFLLRQMNGEFKPKRGRKPKQLTQGNKPSTEATPIIAKLSSEPRNIKTNTEALQFVKNVWGKSLAFNLRSLEIELHGCKLDADEMHTRIADEFNVNMNKERAIDTCFYLARQHSYDPVKDWLTSLQGRPSAFKQEGLAEILFKLRDPYYDEMVYKWMLAAVKRVLEPGCKFDNALILQGPPYIGKSTFFATIVPDEYFDENMGSKLDTDDLRKLHSHLVNEWSELDQFTAKQYSGTIKSFLSRQKDTFRLPYAKELVTYPRRSMVVGTTNESQFLTDTTGNRRFWVLPVQWILHPTHLSAMRDEIWAGVVTDYFENWRGPHNEITLSEDSRQRQTQENEVYLWHDVLEEVLASYLEGKSLYLTMAEIMTYLCDYNEGRLGIKASDRGTTMRVGQILNKLGWKRKQHWTGKTNIKVWVPDGQK